MKNTTPFNKTIVLLAICASYLLSGCDLISPGPNQDEISTLVKSALTTQINNENNANPIAGLISKLIGANELTFNKIEKVSCKSEGNKIVTCQVYVDYEVGPQDQPNKSDDAQAQFKYRQKIQKTINFNFFKSESGWVNLSS